MTSLTARVMAAFLLLIAGGDAVAGCALSPAGQALAQLAVRLICVWFLVRLFSPPPPPPLPPAPPGKGSPKQPYPLGGNVRPRSPVPAAGGRPNDEDEEDAP